MDNDRQRDNKRIFVLIHQVQYCSTKRNKTATNETKKMFLDIWKVSSGRCRYRTWRLMGQSPSYNVP